MIKYIKYLLGVMLLVAPLLIAATATSTPPSASAPKNRLRVVIPSSFSTKDNIIYLENNFNGQSRIIDEVHIVKGQTEFEFNVDKYQGGYLFDHPKNGSLCLPPLSRLDSCFDVTITVYEDGMSTISGVGAYRDSLELERHREFRIFYASITDSLTKYRAFGYSARQIEKLYDTLQAKCDKIRDNKYHEDLISGDPDAAFFAFSMLRGRVWNFNRDSIQKYDAILKHKFPDNENIQRYPLPIIQIEPDEETQRVHAFFLNMMMDRSLPVDFNESVNVAIPSKN